MRERGAGSIDLCRSWALKRVAVVDEMVLWWEGMLGSGEAMVRMRAPVATGYRRRFCLQRKAVYAARSGQVVEMETTAFPTPEAPCAALRYASRACKRGTERLIKVLSSP